MSRRVYVGVNTEVPSGTTTKNLSVANLSDFFTVTNGTSTNTSWEVTDSTTGKIKLVPGNIGIASTTASITLTATRALTNVGISGQYYTETNYDKITLTVAGNTVLSAVSGSVSLSNHYTGALAAGKTIVLSYSKDSSTNATNEADTAFYIACDGIQIPGGETVIKSVARRIKKIYVGVNGIARQVKRAYVGVSNLARQFFGGFDSIQQVTNPISFVESTQTGQTTSGSMVGVAAENLDNTYALFAGSHETTMSGTVTSYHLSKYVYAVNRNLIVSSAAQLLTYSAWLKPAKMNDYVIFASGTYGAYTNTNANANNNYSKYAYAYGLDLARHDLNDLPTSTSAYGAGNGTHAIYPCWEKAYSSTDTSGNVVDKIATYDSNLIQNVVSTNGKATRRIGSMCACRFNDYGIFFGAMSATNSSATYTVKVVAYDQNLTETALPDLTNIFDNDGTCAATANHLFFGGGSYTNSNSVNVYPTSLNVYGKDFVKVSGVSLSVNRRHLKAINIDNWIVFSGGYGTGGSAVRTADIFDENLIRTSINYNSNNPLGFFSGAPVGDYGIFFGYGSLYYNTMIFQGV